MAVNFTPLNAYLQVKNANVEANQRAGAALGQIAGAVGALAYGDKKKKFFDSLGDGEINGAEAQVKEIDESIARLEKELEEVNNELAAMGEM